METITKQKTLIKDKAAVRWLTLLLVSLTMFTAYIASDIFSPLKPLLEQENLWNSTEFGWFGSSYSMFNVFLGMLIFGGLILDKKGIRFAGILSCFLMVAGMAIKYWALNTPLFTPESTIWFFGDEIKKEVFWVIMGYATYGVGAEVAGITVSKAIVKWFTGKSLALAMGLQLSLARLGSAAALIFSPMIAARYHDVGVPVLITLIMLILGSLSFLAYCIYDRRLDREVHSTATSEEESFNVKDVKGIVVNPGFWLIALLCVMFYSAVFPFLKYAADLMVNKFNVEADFAGIIPGMLPFGCILLTPLFGTVYDRIGHGADLMILGAAIITCVHLLFAASFVTHWVIAVILMVFLGIGFAMVPAAMWPSLAKIVPQRQFGTAIALTFFIQNIGLWGMPLLIGKVLDNYCINPEYDVVMGGAKYDYTLPMLIFMSVCVVALFISIWIRILDKKRHYGLQVANVKKSE